MKALGDEVMHDPASRTPGVQRAWHAWERELLAETGRDRQTPGRHLARRVEEMLRRRETLLSEVAGLPVTQGG
jgi:hypothetical protein